jgi:hypothetical protein
LSTRNVPTASGTHVDDAGLDDVDGDGGDEADHPGGDAQQERPDAAILRDGDEPAVQIDREQEGRQEDPERHQKSSRQPAGDVADEGPEDDGRRGQRARAGALGRDPPT